MEKELESNDGDHREGTVERFQCIPIIYCHTIVFNYVNSIDQPTKEKFKSVVIENLDSPRSQLVRHWNLKLLYLQSVRDIELLSENPNSLLKMLL